MSLRDGSKRLFKTLLFAGGCSLASAAPAFAQVAQPTAAATVETLIVTAQKREENLQSVPLSVAAISSTTIERLHVRDFKDITGTVPNVQVQVNAGLSLAASYVIRGIGIAANPSPYVGTEVGTVIDGVVLSVNQIALIDNFDLERIEVLRGPQGTLFGANTTGGVINVITAQPTGQFGGYGQVTLGNYSRMDGAFALNFPIIDDVLAGKVSYSHRQRDGYYTNLYTGDPIGGSNSSQLRAYLKWTPEAHLDVTWIGQVQKIRDGTDVLLDIAYPGEIFFRPTTPFAFQLYSNVPDKHNTDTTSNTITANWEGGIGRVTSITNYLTWKSLGYQDIDGIDAPGYAQVGKQDGWQISQELRDLFHPVESVEMLVGLYAQQWGYYSNGQNWPVFSSPTAIGETINKEKTTNLAAFTQVWWDVTDRLRLQGGLRVSYETVRMYEASVSFVQPAGTDPAKGFSNLVGATQLPLNPLNLPTEAEKSWTNVGGKVAADYKITDDVMAYGYYARGFKSGGFNGRVTLAANIGPYNPEYVDSFEAGIKSHWLDNRLRLNIAAFYNNWQDMQVNQVFYRGNPPVGSSTILNAGKSTTKGVELDGEWVPVDGLRINGTLGYLNTYYNVFKQGNGPTCAPPPAIPSPGCSNDYSGRPLVYSPEWNGSLSATYTWAVGGGKADATLQYIYNGDRWGNYTQAPSEFLKAYSLLNANLTWSPAKEHWAISLWGRNLTNEKYLNLALDAPPLFSEGLFGAPREYGIDFRFNF